MDPRFNDETNTSFAHYLIMTMILLWSLTGVILFLAEFFAPDEYYLKMYGQDMLDLRHAVPFWTMGAYGLAVFAGLIASILLLRGKKSAANLFIFSLVMAVISFIWMFTSSVAAPLRTTGYWVLPLIVVILGGFEIWYARRRIAAGALT